MIIPGVSCIHPILISVPYVNELGVETSRGITVGCGHCVACKMRRTREWTLRLIMESQEWSPERICFVTLTYSPAYLPLVFDEDGNCQPTLVHRNVQLFFKRLRRRIDYPIRFFCVGEYGSLTGRSHHHAVIFGLLSEDWQLVDECWQYGFTLTKSFYNETAGYVAGYIQKKLFGKDVYGLAKPPYLSCSQHLGEGYFMSNISTICKQGFIPFKGFKYPIPRIFARKAVDLGYLPKPDVDEIQLNQNMAISDFLDWCDRNNIQLSDYERNFVAIQENHFKRQNLTRDLNSEV